MKLIPHPLLVLWSGKSRAIPLLPLWTVQPVQNLSACTRAHFTLTYRSSLRSISFIPVTGTLKIPEWECFWVPESWIEWIDKIYHSRQGVEYRPSSRKQILYWQLSRRVIIVLILTNPDPVDRAVWGVVLQPLDYWDCRLESRWRHEVCLLCCVGSGLCDELTTRSEKSYRVCVCVSVRMCSCVCVCLIMCDRETSKWGGLGMIYTETPQII